MCSVKSACRYEVAQHGADRIAWFSCWVAPVDTDNRKANFAFLFIHSQLMCAELHTLDLISLNSNNKYEWSGYTIRKWMRWESVAVAESRNFCCLIYFLKTNTRIKTHRTLISMSCASWSDLFFILNERLIKRNKVHGAESLVRSWQSLSH
jgi:hypothetical protein